MPTRRTAKARALQSLALAQAAKARQANARAAARERARVEALAVAQGVDETVMLAEGRGEAFERPPQKRGERTKPIRRISGLAYLVSREVIDSDLARIGEVWGGLWREGFGPVPLRSCVNDAVGGGGDRTANAIEAAKTRVQAQRRLLAMSLRLDRVPAVWGALVAIAGQGMTPRQYAGNDRAAIAAQTRVVDALELMRAGLRR